MKHIIIKGTFKNVGSTFDILLKYLKFSKIRLRLSLKDDAFSSLYYITKIPKTETQNTGKNFCFVNFPFLASTPYCETLFYAFHSFLSLSQYSVFDPFYFIRFW